MQKTKAYDEVNGLREYVDHVGVDEQQCRDAENRRTPRLDHGPSDRPGGSGD